MPQTPAISSIANEFGQYSDDEENDLVPPSSHPRPLELDPTFRPVQHKKSLLYYLATVQAFLIIYRTEVLLSALLGISISIGISEYISSHTKKHRINPFQHAHIQNDYATIHSKYDLTLGKIDHWCLTDALHGENDNLCSCEDPLEPVSRSSSHKWSDQHKENIKVVTEILMKTTQNWEGYASGPYDDLWLESVDDDWVYGKGARFGDDDYGMFVNEQDDLEYDYDDGFGIPMESGGDAGGVMQPVLGEEGGERRLVNDEEEYVLDVVFVGDSITEQRQGTSMGKEESNYVGIREVFDKTFSKEKVCMRVESGLFFIL
jgi:hypothetical protein